MNQNLDLIRGAFLVVGVGTVLIICLGSLLGGLL